MIEITSIDFFYRLKKGKRSWNEDNIELDIGKEYFAISYIQNKFLLRKVDEFFELRDINKLLKQRLLWTSKEK